MPQRVARRRRSATARGSNAGRNGASYWDIGEPEGHAAKPANTHSIITKTARIHASYETSEEFVYVESLRTLACDVLIFAATHAVIRSEGEIYYRIPRHRLQRVSQSVSCLVLSRTRNVLESSIMKVTHVTGRLEVESSKVRIQGHKTIKEITCHN